MAETYLSIVLLTKGHYHPSVTSPRAFVFLFAFFGSLGLIGPAAFAASTDDSVDGTVVLHDGFGNEGAPCAGTGKYADIKPGAVVTLRDAKNKIMGTGTLGKGVWTAAIPGSDFVHCEFAFTVPVASSSSYAVQVAKRKASKVSRKALIANDWVMTVNVY